MVFRHDVVIVGSGLAGLRAALEIAPSAGVALISKVYPSPERPRAGLPRPWGMKGRIRGNGTCSTR